MRGIGLLWALELVEPGGAGPATPASPTTMGRLRAELHRRRLHLHKRDNQVFLAPPLVITEAELEEGLVALGGALDESFA